jgi:putative two-component system response regulator
MGLDEAHVSLLEHAAPLHDVGKIGIPDTVLTKPGSLVPEEFELMSRHAVLGKTVLEPLSQTDQRLWHNHTSLGADIIGPATFPLLKMAALIALTHHEKWDGTGYPIGLAGEDIPLEGRIVAVADVFDALASKRPYKSPFPREKCFAILKEGRGTHFDPAVLDAFFAASDQVIKVQMELPDL